MTGNKTPILIIAGPTSSGKSDLAIRLARKLNGEIISADSRQIYRGMNLGTGKVERDKGKGIMDKRFYSEGIRHFCIDIASPKRQYSVAQWRKEAQRAIRDICRRGKLPILCGGTGFYIDTLIYQSVLPTVKPDAKLRSRLAKLTPLQLYERLRKLDPRRATNIDRQNPRRLIRALEIVLKTKKPVPKIQGIMGKGEGISPYHTRYLVLSPDLPTLRRRIEKRLDARLKAGMIAEVRHLHETGVSWKRLESFGLEYRWASRYLREIENEKRKTEKDAFQKMRTALLHDIIAYTKRQLTWWRKNPDALWIQKPGQADRLLEKFLP